MNTTRHAPSPTPRATQQGETDDQTHTDAEAQNTSVAVDSTETSTSKSNVDRSENSEANVEDPATPAKDSGKLATARRRVPQPRLLAVALVILLLLGATGFFGYQWYQQRQLASERADAAAAAREYALDLSTYNYKKIEKNFRTIMSNSTDSFAKQYQKVSQNLQKLIKKYRAVSKATVVKAAVASSSLDRAVVLLFVDQTITNTNSPKPRTDRNRMQVTVLKQDGEWLLHEVRLL